MTENTQDPTSLLRQAAKAARHASRQNGSWRPSVQAALAAWLDAEADIQESVPQVAQAVADLVATVQQNGMDVTVAASTLDYAAAVAAAYLSVDGV